MTNNFVSRLVRGLAVAVAFGVLTAAGVAHAGQVRLSWTPPFGDAYPDLSFAGVAHHDDPSDCTNTTAVIVGVDEACNVSGSPQIAFHDVALFLYDNPDELGDPVILDFMPAQDVSTNPTFSTIQNIVIGGNAIVGLNSVIFGPIFPSADVGGITTETPVWLQFVTTFNGGFSTCPIEGSCIPDAPLAFMFLPPTGSFEGTDECPGFGGDLHSTTSCIRSNEASVTITSVPEPASLALLAAALGAGVFGRRRRRF